MIPPLIDPVRTLLDTLLEEQGQLTAVDRFARAHVQAGDLPAQSRYYRALIPLEKPRPGEQYAFSVDLDSCSGCKACVSACHSLNGLDEHETWRSTGLLHGGTVAEPYQQVVTTACHHCVDPACLNGCPVLAYEKDPLTGIVRHLDDQCIGCQDRVLKCPYDVPQYSAKRGIVRKCDMCHSRLAADEAPACVQACPSAAISIRITSQADIARLSAQPNQRLLPGTVASAYTQPTSLYSSRRAFPPNVLPAGSELPRVEPAHWPLIWMLLLTQAATGLSVISGLLALLWPAIASHASGAFAICTNVLLHLGLASSVLHLGRPWGAWRAFLGWRRSWMSREILAFSCFAGVSAAWITAHMMGVSSPLIMSLNSATAGLGVLSVFCSAMIYVDTRRSFWAASKTFPRFIGATVLLGSAAAAALLSIINLRTGANVVAAAHLAGWLATVIRTGLFLWEANDLYCALSNPVCANHQSALIVWRRYPFLLASRVLLFVVSTLCGLSAVWESGAAAAVLATASFLATFSASVLERHCFFVAVVAPKMPGVLTHEC